MEVCGISADCQRHCTSIGPYIFEAASYLYISDGEPHLHGEIASPSRGFSLIVTD